MPLALGSLLGAVIPVQLAATGYSGVIRLVQWCVIALIFLLFLRVIRAVWVEVRPAGPRQGRSARKQAARGTAAYSGANPASAGAFGTGAAAGATATGTLGVPARNGGGGRGRGKGDLALYVIEPSDRSGQRFDVDGEATIGRSPGCPIATTYDIYSSTLHARLFRQNGKLFVEDLGSTNGTFVNSERITKPTKLGRGDLVQVGATVFEVTR